MRRRVRGSVLVLLAVLVAAGGLWAWRRHGAAAPAPALVVRPAAPRERLAPAGNPLPLVRRQASAASLRAPGSPTPQRRGDAAGTPVAMADRCRRAVHQRPEPVGAERTGAARAGAEDSTSPEALARYLAQRGLQQQPRYRLVAASTALWFFRELRAQVVADLRGEELDRRRGMSAGPPRRAELLEQLRQLDEATGAALAEIAGSRRAPLACEDPLVQKAALCTGYQRLGAVPEGSSLEAVERFCSTDELRALVSLVRLGDQAPYWERAPRAMVHLAYELDHAYLVARSAEVCLASPRYLPYVEEKLNGAPPHRRGEADGFLYAIRDSRAELAQSGLAPLRCEEPEVQGIIGCVVRAGVTGPLEPRCQSPELQVVLARVRRG